MLNLNYEYVRIRLILILFKIAISNKLSKFNSYANMLYTKSKRCQVKVFWLRKINLKFKKYFISHLKNFKTLKKSI